MKKEIKPRIAWALVGDDNKIYPQLVYIFKNEACGAQSATDKVIKVRITPA